MNDRLFIKKVLWIKKRARRLLRAYPHEYTGNKLAVFDASLDWTQFFNPTQTTTPKQVEAASSRLGVVLEADPTTPAQRTIMSMPQPTHPLRALRNTTPRRTCNDLGICQHPYAPCGAQCEMPPVPQRLAPGVLDGPYSRPGTAPWRGAGIRLALLTLGITIVLGVLYVSL